MFQFQSEKLEENSVVRFSLFKNEAQLTWEEVITLWEQDANFRTFFASILQSSSYSAFRWETPSVSWETSSRPFEFVLINSPRLTRSPDRKAFADYFSASKFDADKTEQPHQNSRIAVFPSLGKDSMLVVPSPLNPDTRFVHLAEFMQRADANLIDSFWQIVGATVKQELNENPIWVNTAGGGVAWLHLRIDTRPKYYKHLPYKNDSSC